MKDPVVEYIVIGVYLLVILMIGPACRKLNNNTSDYFRSGCRGTWWIIGMSTFMSATSALTFTGNGGAAFMAGWSVLAIYFGGLAGVLVHAVWLARWYRQLRVTTFPEALRARFGPGTQQVYAGLSILMALLVAAIWLLGLAIFSATAFALPLQMTIPVLGLTVLFYSATGGRWAVLAADSIQGLVMITMTVLLSVLCIIYSGGISGFFEAISQQNLQDAFRFIKPEGAFADNTYSWKWLLAIFTIQFVASISLISSIRYFAVKDGPEGCKAALLTAVLMALGMLLWFIPPMTARIFYAEEVLSSGMPRPEEAAFAVIAIKLLPSGLVGMIVVAMFAATMSSIDTGLNANAAMLIRDILPAVFRRLGRPLPMDSQLLRWSRMVTVVFGILVIGLSFYLSLQDGTGIFQFALGVSATLVMPMSVPLMLCLFIRRGPRWACLFSMTVALIPSIIAFLQPGLFTFSERAFWVIGTGTIAYLLAVIFPGTSQYKEQVDIFFEQMHRPVDFEQEVGQKNDMAQLVIISRFAMVIGGLMFFLLLIPNPFAGRIAIVSAAGLIFVFGGIFHLVARIQSARQNRQ